MTCRIFEAKQPYIAMGAFIDQSSLLVGDVEVGEESSIWPYAVLRGDVQAIRVGMKSNIQDGCVLHVTHPNELFSDGHPLVIGNQVSINQRCSLRGCTIGDNVFIGSGSIIMDDAKIESNTIIGPGSFVASGVTVEGGNVWQGSTKLEKVRKLTKEDAGLIKITAEQYVQLKNRYLIEFQRQREREREKF